MSAAPVKASVGGTKRKCLGARVRCGAAPCAAVRPSVVVTTASAFDADGTLADEAAPEGVCAAHREAGRIASGRLVTVGVASLASRTTGATVERTIGAAVESTVWAAA
jgi:hypothetical protein